MSLRRRLVIGLVVLVGLGLVASDIATYAALSSYLNGRVESQLASARRLAYHTLSSAPCAATGQGGDQSSKLLQQLNQTVGTGTVVEVLGPYGLPACSGEAQPVVGASAAISNVIQSFDSGSITSSGVRYKAEAAALPDGNAMVVGVSLQAVEQTLSRLVKVEVIVSLAVLAGLALLAWFLVRAGLRPLDEMASTARTITEGSLTRRVRSSDPRTEVGQLGRALNVMLSRLEAAFAATKSSEDRLRRFVADASHELRTPLTSIRGYAELFRRGASRDPAAVERAMTRIEGEASRMSGMVDDLLLLARLDQGRPLAASPFDLAVVAAEAAEDAGVVDRDRPISYSGDQSVVVTGDEQRMRQVAANLLSNAIAHTPPLTPVQVRAVGDGAVGVLEVVDEGPGIRPEDLDHVFERFYRADSTRRRGGSGLGLSIVAAVAAAQGGKATVESVVGEGTTFRVEVPLSPPPPAGSNGTAARPPAHEPAGQSSASSQA